MFFKKDTGKEGDKDMVYIQRRPDGKIEFNVENLRSGTIFWGCVRLTDVEAQEIIRGIQIEIQATPPIL